MQELTSQIILAFVQGITEFLPVSSDGHLALVSNLISTPSLPFMVFLHLASLLAVLIFTRKEVIRILKFEKNDRPYLKYLLLGIIPTGIAGFLLRDIIAKTESSLLIAGLGFIFTGFILLFTYGKTGKNKINSTSALSVSFMQILALLPGVSRSAMTISTAKFFGVENEEAFKFSFLILIPLSLAAFVLEANKINFSVTYIVPFVVCMLVSLLFLKVLEKIIIKDKFWMFSIYCFLIGVITLVLYSLNF